MISLDKYNDTHIDGELEPTSYNQAVNGPYSDLWKEGIQQELDALHSNNTWSVVPIPVGQNVVGSKWVFKLKHDADGNINRHKALLVAQRYSQQHGFDYEELYSPVVRYDSLRLLIALSVYHHWHPQQLDIKAAFLYGILNKDIYMQLPEGSRVDGMYGKLNKCIYGLKQSPREWYHRLIDFLTPYGFVVSNFDPCVLMFKNDNDTNNILFIAVFVDNLSLFGPKGLVMDNLKDLLKSEFKVTDLGDLHWLLGIRIEYRDHDITLLQSAYIDTILKRFGLYDCNPVTYPLDKNHQINKATTNADNTDSEVNIKLYQQMVGSLMYTVIGTRPDITFTVTRLSQFLTKPTKNHFGQSSTFFDI